jgi:hypothetical protein
MNDNDIPFFDCDFSTEMTTSKSRKMAKYGY